MHCMYNSILQYVPVSILECYIVAIILENMLTLKVYKVSTLIQNDLPVLIYSALSWNVF